ncbi:MAG: hypothetical protein J0M35_04155 [Candidatus Obscuribacter phosphatis]|uniref:Uncharacterized protein n=1 Tax=Candidatus Obscuribacter phosphatis TaxID=1906157 RepID=A0A8J7TK61_9BACT|nr:hypothetical protein [Candidatus Obscuribacter phosphatis]
MDKISLILDEQKAHKLIERLGRLREAFPDAKIERAIQLLSESLKGDIKADEVSKAQGEKLNKRLRLGQLCLASGMISLEQLAEAMALQNKSDIPLGEILLAKQWISQEELDGLLIAQDLITGEEECTDQEGLSLLALGLITEEAIAIGLLEKRISGNSLKEVLARRGWLQSEIFEAVFSND